MSHEGINHYPSDIETARAWYGGATNTTGTPLIEHATEVAVITEDSLRLCPDISTDEVKNATRAALAHDLIEDTEVAESELQRQWGKEVSEMAAELSNKKGDTDFEDYIDFLAEKSSELAYIVKLADILANVRNSLRNFSNISPEWMRKFWIPLLEKYENRLFGRQITNFSQAAEHLKVEIIKEIVELKTRCIHL